MFRQWPTGKIAASVRPASSIALSVIQSMLCPLDPAGPLPARLTEPAPRNLGINLRIMRALAYRCGQQTRVLLSGSTDRPRGLIRPAGLSENESHGQAPFAQRRVQAVRSRLLGKPGITLSNGMPSHTSRFVSGPDV